MRTAHSVIFRILICAGITGLLAAPWAPAEVHTHSETCEADHACAEAEGHEHAHPTSPESARRLIANRHHVDGITAAGYWLLRNGYGDEALEVLEKGTEDNPDEFQVFAVLGQLHFRNAQKSTNEVDGAQSYDSALTAYVRAAELGLAQHAATDPANWTEYLDVDLRGAARMAALLDIRKGDPDRGRDLARKALDELGSDDILERALTE